MLHFFLSPGTQEVALSVRPSVCDFMNSSLNLNAVSQQSLTSLSPVSHQSLSSLSEVFQQSLSLLILVILSEHKILRLVAFSFPQAVIVVEVSWNKWNIEKVVCTMEPEIWVKNMRT